MDSGARVTLQDGSFSGLLVDLRGGHVEQSGGSQTWNSFRIYDGSWDMNAGTAWFSSGLYASLAVGSGAGNAGTFHQTGGTIVTGSPGLALAVGTEDATGLAIIEGPSTVLGDFPSTETSVIGHGLTGAGRVFLRDGATARLGDTIVGLMGGAGSLTIDGGASATLHTLAVGSGTSATGVGTVLLTGGARLAVGNTFSFSGPVGIINVGTNAGTGTGYLRVESGTLTTHAPSGPGGFGAILVRGGSTFDLAGGFARTGTLFVSGLVRHADGTLIGSAAQVIDGRFHQSGGAGSFNLLTLNNAASGSFELTGGALTIGQLNHTAGHSRFTGGSLSLGTGVITGGTMTVAGAAVRGTGSMFVRAPARVSFESGELDVGPLTLDGGRVVVSSGGDKVLRATELSFTTTPGGQVDLGDNAMAVDYAAGSSPAEQIRAYIASAYNGGAWTGDGLTSSAAAANPNHALGYAEASALASIPPLFGTVDDTTLLVRYTRWGDADLNHVVNLGDFNALAANFGTGDAWHEGDFNYDGITNLNDFNLLAANFGSAAGGSELTSSDWAALASAVPEPAAPLALLTVALAARLRRRTSRIG